MAKRNKKIVTDAEALERDADMLEREAGQDIGEPMKCMALDMARRMRKVAHAIRSGKIRGVPIR